MKKIITLLLIAIGISFGAQAQSTAPFYGTTTKGNAASALFVNYYNSVLTDVASATLDTVKIYPAWRNYNVTLTVLDSCTLKLNTLKGCYYNDHLDLFITNPAQTGVIKFLGGFVLNSAATSLSLTANKKYLIRFFFDGANWVEYAVQANY